MKPPKAKARNMTAPALQTIIPGVRSQGTEPPAKSNATAVLIQAPYPEGKNTRCSHSIQIPSLWTASSSSGFQKNRP